VLRDRTETPHAKARQARASTAALVSSVAIREALASSSNGAEDAEDAEQIGPELWLIRTRRRRLSQRWLLGIAVVLVAAAGLVGLSLRASGGHTRHPTLVADAFTRADTRQTLGTTDSGQAWQAVHGVWAIRDHAARLVRITGAKSSFAVVDTGSPDGTVTLTESTVAPGAGLVFRYRDPSNYWAVEAAPRYGTWAIRKVSGGRQIVGANTGLSGLANGTTVTVRFKGTAIDVFVNGVRRHTLVDSDFSDATMAGLEATGAGATDARWASFRTSTGVETPSTTTGPR